MPLIDQHLYLCLCAKVHLVVLAFAFADNVLDLDGRVFGNQEKSFIGVWDLPLLDHILLGLPIFGTVVLDIDPKLILIPDYPHNLYLVAVLAQLIPQPQPSTTQNCFLPSRFKSTLVYPIFIIWLLFSLLRLIFLPLLHFTVLLSAGPGPDICLCCPQPLLRFSGFLQGLLRLELDALDHQLPLDSQQSLDKRRFSEGFKFNGELQVVDKIGDDCLQLLIVFKVVNIYLRQVFGACLVFDPELVVGRVIVRDQGQQSAVVIAQRGLLLAPQLRPELIKLTVCDVELVFLDLHLNGLDGWPGQGAELVEAHRFPSEVRQRPLQLCIADGIKSGGLSWSWLFFAEADLGVRKFPHALFAGKRAAERKSQKLPH